MFSLSIASIFLTYPWVQYENLGAWVNNKIEGVDKASIWASLNAIPTIAHTVWGVLCGLVLMSSRSSAEKIRILVIAGAVGWSLLMRSTG